MTIYMAEGHPRVSEQDIQEGRDASTPTVRISDPPQSFCSVAKVEETDSFMELQTSGSAQAPGPALDSTRTLTDATLEAHNSDRIHITPARETDQLSVPSLGSRQAQVPGPGPVRSSRRPHRRRPAPYSKRLQAGIASRAPAGSDDSTELAVDFGSATYTNYKLFPLGRSGMRLIRLRPDVHGGIAATMSSYSLKSSDTPVYVALSYAWGDSGDTKLLSVNFEDVQISSSLYSALQALSKAATEDLFVWADALCIDQGNLYERNRQVQKMPEIYQNAKYVAVWLGPACPDDMRAKDFMNLLLDSDETLRFSLRSWPKQDLYAVASLFSRAYWSRLWIVQELYNAKDIHIYYGDLRDSWATFHHASMIFRSHAGKEMLDALFPFELPATGDETPLFTSQDHLSCAQILMYHGPGSFGDIFESGVNDVDTIPQKPDDEVFQRLLNMMQLSRRKKATDPRDRVFAIRGALPARIRRNMKVDYSMSLKDIYTDVVSLIMAKTQRLDVICESIHFPLYRGIVDLPSWVPDWAHTPMTSSLAARYPELCHADGNTRAIYRFDGVRRNRLLIKAVLLGTIKTHGCALNTGCRANDYIKAFEGWRLELLNHFKPVSIDIEDNTAWEGKGQELKDWMSKEEEFCRTLSLGKASKADCYPLLAAMLRWRYPYQPLDAELRRELKRHQETKGNTVTRVDRQFLQDTFGENMMGRCFCVTSKGNLGLGSGYMSRSDVVVVALGCCTPIILRPQGVTENNERVYRFVGDVYVDGYMNGEAIKEEQSEWHNYLMQ